MIYKIPSSVSSAKPILLKKSNDHYDTMTTKIKWYNKTPFKSQFQENAILRIPFISAEHSKDIRNILRNSSLHVIPVFTSGKKIEELVCRSALLPNQCETKRCPFKDSSCRRRNVIYELSCAKCQDTYVGETKRDLHIRTNEHLRHTNQGNVQASAMAAHYAKVHATEEIPHPPFTSKVLERARDNADRLIREATWIRKKRPAINRDEGWKSLANKFLPSA